MPIYAFVSIKNYLSGKNIEIHIFWILTQALFWEKCTAGHVATVFKKLVTWIYFKVVQTITDLFQNRCIFLVMSPKMFFD